MTLNIIFDNSGGDMHLILTDGCKVKLDSEDSRLNANQINCSRREGLRGYPLYQNIIPLENFYLNPEGMLRIYCPTCQTEYIITKEQYEKELEKFCDTEREKWETIPT